MNEIEIPRADLTKTVLLFERQPSGLYVLKWQEGTNGSAHVRPIQGTAETTKNRNIASAQTAHPGDDSTNTATWTQAENVTEVTIDGGANGTLVLFDALDGPDAKALLEETGGINLDVQYDFVPAGKTRTYTGTSWFSRVDVVPLTAAERKIIGAQ
ncbi:MAG TPA: hypothetical protein ENK05_11825 [Gammaproteobacteria bacterium]|nr:hypothetical protein [Gammaproteobacteria bacterium]